MFWTSRQTKDSILSFKVHVSVLITARACWVLRCCRSAFFRLFNKIFIIIITLLFSLSLLFFLFLFFNFFLNWCIFLFRCVIPTATFTCFFLNSIVFCFLEIKYLINKTICWKNTRFCVIISWACLVGVWTRIGFLHWSQIP